MDILGTAYDMIAKREKQDNNELNILESHYFIRSLKVAIFLRLVYNFPGEGCEFIRVLRVPDRLTS